MDKRHSLTWQQTLLAVGVIVACALWFWNPKSQSPSWIYPYFSGAANLGLDLAWRVDISGFADFEGMTYTQQMDYRFSRAEPGNLAPYSVLDKGYVFVIWIAQTVLFWLAPIKACIWLQILFHVTSSLWVAGRLGSRRQQVIFTLAYAVNPVVLHFVTFAYYYYWQVIPALAWLWYETRKGVITSRGLYLLALVLAAAFLLRQSTIIVSLFILAYAAWRHKRIAAWGAVVCFIAFAMFAKPPSQPWHTAYVGIGAYPNDAGIELDDESGYRMFRDKVGIQIDTTPPNGNFYDEKVRGQYYVVLKERLTSYAKEHPMHLMRNAVLNVLQGFSVGYPVGHPVLAYASAFLGLAVLSLLVFFRMYVTITIVLLSMLGFVVYYPPIPAYMFGNYLLLSLALTRLCDQVSNSEYVVAFGRYLKERL